MKSINWRLDWLQGYRASRILPEIYAWNLEEDIYRILNDDYSLLVFGFRLFPGRTTPFIFGHSDIMNYEEQQQGIGFAGLNHVASTDWEHVLVIGFLHRPTGSYCVSHEKSST
ncbi:hypothetical protein AKJ16_DCAP03973 [Drosera capensis]